MGADVRIWDGMGVSHPPTPQPHPYLPTPAHVHSTNSHHTHQRVQSFFLRRRPQVHQALALFNDFPQLWRCLVRWDRGCELGWVWGWVGGVANMGLASPCMCVCMVVVVVRWRQLLWHGLGVGESSSEVWEHDCWWLADWASVWVGVGVGCWVLESGALVA